MSVLTVDLKRIAAYMEDHDEWPCNYVADARTILEAAAEIERLRAVADRRARALHFLASVIKSGESWTQACEAEYREALKP